MGNKMKYRQLMLSLAIAMIWAFAAGTAWAEPIYFQTFQDAVTGDNEFKDTKGSHRWFVNTDADSYANDEYERPTAQTYEDVTAAQKIGTDSELQVGNSYAAAGSSDPSYFGYLDIVKGRYGYDDTHMYFGIELYSDYKVGDSGNMDSDFGESSVYRIRLSTVDNAETEAFGGLMLSAEAGADFQKPEYSSFNTEKSMAYLDTDGDVGGPGGITTTNENPGGMTGYEDKVISDGKMDSKENVLSTRKTTIDGKPMVEFKFNYQVFNMMYKDYALDPNALSYLVFEANRGLKDNSNYLWNDKYAFNEAGTPYDSKNSPQNVYELDTLRGVSTVPPPGGGVPEPGSMILLGSALFGAWGARRMRRRKQKEPQA